MTVHKFLDPKNDIAFRRIFGTEKNKDILIHFVNDILNLKGEDKIKEVTFQPTIQDPEIAYQKQSVIDILCRDEKGEYLIVEMQVSPQKGFEKRAQYYASKAYSRQLKEGKEEGARYEDLKAVVFIAICQETIFQDKEAYISRHIILDEKTYSQDLKDFSFTFIELDKFKITEISDLKTIVDKWCYFFKHAGKTSEQEAQELIGKDEVIERAYQELNQFNWSQIELNTYEKEQKRLWDNRAAEDFILDKGIQQGIQQGIEKGEHQKSLLIAKNMITKGYSISEVEEIIGLSRQEIESI